EEVARAALALSVPNPLHSLQTMAAARALAVTTLGEAALTRAAELVLGPRAIPPAAADTPPEPPTDPPAEDHPDSDASTSDAGERMADRLVEAVATALPGDLLAACLTRARLAAARAGSGQGARIKGNRTGRPQPARPGKPRDGARIDLLATLRRAAPYQTLRRAGGRVVVLPPDLAIRRHAARSDRVVVFAVDASGSAAVARLAEAKGAVETLLSQAYRSRDSVALISFRGNGAELLLPPTRSLVAAKRRLSALPGGGGTPLAAGLLAAQTLAKQEAARGFTPMVVLVTDGKANIALDGTPGARSGGRRRPAHGAYPGGGRVGCGCA
ncbi:MAG: VWA domain-containing protein, partial [Pseudomonadota bacterium]